MEVLDRQQVQVQNAEQKDPHFVRVCNLQCIESVPTQREVRLCQPVKYKVPQEHFLR
jgi:hypothetical protein